MKNLMLFEPFRTMRKWDPFDDLRIMQRDINRMYQRFLGEREGASKGMVEWTPSMERYIKDGKLIYKAELPGVDPKDIDVSVTERELIIKGERKMEQGSEEEGHFFKEIEYGKYERHVALPENINIQNIKAKYANGVLEISMPMSAAERSKKIKVETAEAKITGQPQMKKAA